MKNDTVKPEFKRRNIGKGTKLMREKRKQDIDIAAPNEFIVPLTSGRCMAIKTRKRNRCALTAADEVESWVESVAAHVRERALYANHAKMDVHAFHSLPPIAESSETELIEPRSIKKMGGRDVKSSFHPAGDVIKVEQGIAVVEERPAEAKAVKKKSRSKKSSEKVPRLKKNGVLFKSASEVVEPKNIPETLGKKTASSCTSLTGRIRGVLKKVDLVTTISKHKVEEEIPKIKRVVKKSGGGDSKGRSRRATKPKDISLPASAVA